jgi:O-antigen/teichoic acid export membrane protein
MHIAKSIFQSVLWRGLLYLSTFVLNILIARHFEAGVSGSFYYVINIFSLLQLLAGLSMESGILYFGATREIPPARLFNFSLTWTFLAVIFLWLILAGFKITAPQSFSPGQLKVFAVFFISGSLLYNYSTALFYAQKNFFVPNMISLCLNLLLIGLLPYNGTSIIAVINDANYFYLYFSFLLAQGLFTVIAFYLTRIKKVNFRQPSMAELKDLFRYSLLAWAGNIVFFLLYRVDYWFVETYCSSEALGNYIQVSKLGQLFFLLPSMIATAILPLAVTENKETMLQWLALLSRFFLYAYAVVCLVLVLVGYWLFPFIFGDSFNQMYRAFIFLIPGILSLSTLYTLTAYNAGKNQLKANILGCLYALMVVVAGNWWLVPVYGINAAAAVSSVAYVFYQVYLLIDFRKENNSGIKPFFVFKFGDITSLQKLLTSKK